MVLHFMMRALPGYIVSTVVYCGNNTGTFVRSLILSHFIAYSDRIEY